MHAMMLFFCHAFHTFHRRFLAGQATHFDCVHMAAFSPRRALRLAMLIAMTLVVLGQGTVSDSPAPPASFLNLLFYRRFQGWSFSIAMSSIPLSGTDTVPCTRGLCQTCLNATACRPNCRSPFPSRTLPRPPPPELLHSIRDNA